MSYNPNPPRFPGPPYEVAVEQPSAIEFRERNKQVYNKPEQWLHRTNGMRYYPGTEIPMPVKYQCFYE